MGVPVSLRNHLTLALGKCLHFSLVNWKTTISKFLSAILTQVIAQYSLLKLNMLHPPALISPAIA